MTLGNLKNQATGLLDQYKNQSPATYAAAQQAIGGLLILDGFLGLPHPFDGKKRTGIFGAVIGVIFGIIFILIPTIFGSLSGINKMTATTNATVVSVTQSQSNAASYSGSSSSQQSATTCSAVASYSVNGKQYIQASSLSSSSMCSLGKGQSLNIHYNPKNPSQWATSVKTATLILSIFFYLGIFMVISSVIMVIIKLLSIFFGWKLIKSGRKLAKTLPEGIDLSGTIHEIENAFKSTVFGFPPGAGNQSNPIQNLMQQQSNMNNQFNSPNPVNVPQQNQVYSPQQTNPNPVVSPQPNNPTQPYTPNEQSLPQNQPVQNNTPPEDQMPNQNNEQQY